MAMWWKSQNLDRPVKSADGRVWHFRVWHDIVGGKHAERIYFWDDSQEFMGCAEFAGDQSLHVSKLKQRMRKIVTDPAYGDRFRRELQFPVERHYS
jgi:hypothetical protein